MSALARLRKLLWPETYKDQPLTIGDGEVFLEWMRAVDDTLDLMLERLSALEARAAIAKAQEKQT